MNADVRKELLELRNSTVKSDFVFVNPATGRRHVEIKKGFLASCREAGVRDFRFHDTRHMAATRMGEAGIDPFTIAAILGHKSIAMTASYTHATQRAKRLAVAALEEAIEKQGHNEERRPKLAAAK